MWSSLSTLEKCGKAKLVMGGLPNDAPVRVDQMAVQQILVTYAAGVPGVSELSGNGSSTPEQHHQHFCALTLSELGCQVAFAEQLQDA